jgi:DMSO/TMAO reductase YedYZ molybdopterin-dependent catalytic subunit
MPPPRYNRDVTDRNPLHFPGKDPGLGMLGRSPLVAETPESLLDDKTTPVERFFIRNNGNIPQPCAEPDAWTLAVDGEVRDPLTLTLRDLKARYPAVTRHMVLECGGNGRAFFEPHVHGNQWTNGGVGCAAWTGVALGSVLEDAGLTEAARYTAHYGADAPLTGDPSRPALSRGVRIAKALEPHSMLVWGMNGAPLSAVHGGPLRLIYPGWPGSASQKWLTRITIRDREHDGPGMTGFSYRMPNKPLIPGEVIDPQDFSVLESMPVRSIITHPADGARVASTSIDVRGAAWAGDFAVSRVEVSVDGGEWRDAELKAPRNRYDWRRWSAQAALPASGASVIRARATDENGVTQPETPTLWNPGGYGGNAIHRIAIWVG